MGRKCTRRRCGLVETQDNDLLRVRRVQKVCGKTIWDLGLLENLIKVESFGCFCSIFKGREDVNFLDGLMSLCVNDQRS